MGQQALHSLALGSIYALLTAGFTFMYGSCHSLYLAYGGLYALGGYVTWWTVRANHTIWTALGVAVGLCTAVGFLSHWGLRIGSPKMSETSRLFTGLGLLVCLEEFYRLWIGPYRLKVIALDSHHIHHLGPLMVTDVHWFVFGGTFVVLMIIQGFLRTSQAGRSLQRALLQSGPAVTLGCTSRLRALAVGLGTALAGVGGGLAGLYLNDVHPAMGTMITHKILALVLIGSLGSLHGAIIAAYALALTEGILLPILHRSIPVEAVLLIVLIMVCVFCPGETYEARRPQKGVGL